MEDDVKMALNGIGGINCFRIGADGGLMVARYCGNLLIT
jgi:hypothetical protein